MYKKLLNDYLRSAGNRIGQTLSLEDNGLCVFLNDRTQQEYIVELPHKSQIVYLYAPVCKVPYDYTEEFFEKILEFNLCGVEYNQATFGLDSRTQNIVISYTRTMETLDEISFVNILCNFIKTTDRAKKNLVQLVESLVKEYSFLENDNDDATKSYQPKLGSHKLKA